MIKLKDSAEGASEMMEIHEGFNKISWMRTEMRVKIRIMGVFTGP